LRRKALESNAVEPLPNAAASTPKTLNDLWNAWRERRAINQAAKEKRRLEACQKHLALIAENLERGARDGKSTVVVYDEKEDPWDDWLLTNVTEHLRGLGLELAEESFSEDADDVPGRLQYYRRVVVTLP
jgi:hypothetical protein